MDGDCPIVKRLPCKLTPPEVDARAREHAAKFDVFSVVERNKKDSNAAFAAQLKRLRAEIDVLTGVVRDQVEQREVECYEYLNHAVGKVELIRCDTHEVIHARRMTPDERQVPLRLDDEDDREVTR